MMMSGGGSRIGAMTSSTTPPVQAHHSGHQQNTAAAAVFPVSSRSSSMERMHEEETSALLAEVEDLKRENDNLRQIQEQFWLLLYEKEDLQREVESLRLGANSNIRQSRHSRHTPPHQHPPGSASSTDVQQGSETRPPASGAASASVATVPQAEYDAVSNALHECLELLVDKEQRLTLERTELGSRGPVCAFLSWLSLSHDRATALKSLVAARDDVGMQGGNLSPRNSRAIGVFSPTYGLGSISKEEKEALLRELHTTKLELKQVQDELDRTDMSRLQALEDSERMQQQIELLSKGVQDLRQAYNAVKQQAESSTRNAQAVQTLKSQVAEKDALVHELRAQVAQLQRLGSVGGGSDLAADAARIRRELAERSESLGRGRSQQNIMLSP